MTLRVKRGGLGDIMCVPPLTARLTAKSFQETLIRRAGCDDSAIAARQDLHFGHFRFGIRQDEVRWEAGLGHSHVGARITAASRDHCVVDRGEPVKGERGDLCVANYQFLRKSVIRHTQAPPPQLSDPSANLLGIAMKACLPR
jgi:hypothetical protein